MHEIHKFFGNFLPAFIKYLTRSATEKLVHSLISSRLDFGNGLLYNLPNSQIGQLQKLQNAAARIVSLSSKRSHITPILKTLHWLPVKERIIFKILLFVYYIVNGTAPDYNKSLLRLYQPTRTLWSSNSGLLQIPLSKKFRVGTSFCSCRTSQVEFTSTGAEGLKFFNIL